MVPLYALAPLVALAAALYASVGHGGASAYLAILTLAGFAAGEVAPVVLVMNVGVASASALSFARAGHLRHRLLWPFAAASIPAAFLGGLVALPGSVREGLLGVALAAAAVRFLAFPTLRSVGSDGSAPPPLALALAVGAALGFLAGATGIGGGVYLTPLLLLAGWAEAKPAAAASAAFIVLNSASGLAGHLARGARVDLELLAPLLAAALVGGAAGAWLASRRLGSATLQRALGVVLLVAALRAFLA